MASEGGASLKGLRLLTMDRGPEGYGFHMYTNKELKGQYVKWVAPGGPADLNGMLAGDHIIEVDDVNVVELTHHEVVQRIRGGDGNGRKFLIIDQQTEKELNDKNEPIKSENAIVMIPRTPSEKQTPTSPSPNIDDILQEADGAPSAASPSRFSSDDQGLSSQSPIPAPIPGPSSSTGLTMDMQAARPQKKATRRAQVKQQDWRTAIKTYNAL